jgi:hypothetical protein
MTLMKPSTHIATQIVPKSSTNYSSSDGESVSNESGKLLLNLLTINEAINTFSLTDLNTFCILCLSNINVLRRMNRRKFLHKGRLISLKKSYQVQTGIKITDIGRQMICEICELQLKCNYDESGPIKKAKFELGASSAATISVANAVCVLPTYKKDGSKPGKLNLNC